MFKFSILLALLIKLVNGLNVSTYTVHRHQKSWSDASKICQSEGKQLLTITSNEILQFLTDSNNKPPFNGILFGNQGKEIWTGLSTHSRECKSYTWNGDTPLGQWTNWDKDEPNVCSTDKCIRMANLKWRTINCTNTYLFICEGDSQLTSTVDVSTTTAIVMPTTRTVVMPTAITDVMPTTRTVVMTTTASSAVPTNIRDIVMPTTRTIVMPTTKTVVIPTTRTVVMSTTTTTVVTTIATAAASCSEICSWLATNSTKTVCSAISRELNNTLNSKDLEKEIEKIKEELTVTKATTQMYVRSKISVYEERTSAKTMGIVGITIIAVLIGLVVIPDVVALIHFIVKKLQ